MSWSVANTHAQCRRCRWYVKQTTLNEQAVCKGPLACRRDKRFDYRHDTLAAKELR